MFADTKVLRGRIKIMVLAVAGLLVLTCIPGIRTSHAAVAGKSSKSSTVSKKSSAGSSVSAASSSKRKVARTRKEMILEVEMQALKEALSSRQDQESTNQFVSKAEKEFESAQVAATKSREMLTVASEETSKISAAKDSALAVIEKVKAAAEEVMNLANEAKKESKLAGIEATTYVELRKEAKDEVAIADERENMALQVLQRATEKEAYYRELVKRRINNAEDFYYIAEAAMSKGGNAQAMEFAIKAKAEMEQAKIAETEADIRAEAVKAAEKVLEARKEASEGARIRSRAFAKLMKIAEEISTSLQEAAAAAQLSAQAAQKVLDKANSFAASKDEVLTFANDKVTTLTEVKDSAERKEILSGEAAQSARAVLAAKQKAQAQAEARAQSALTEARGLVIKTPPPAMMDQQQAPTEGQQQ
ncbi:hypothetical protein JW933_04460 [candidate division FCPU426 bacterium]|nr:hypothetical protein [candidate division FCPU426 bacterium]